MASEKVKYTTKVKQAQHVGGAVINPKGGELSADEVKAITANPYGKDLIIKGFLSIDGVKQEDVAEKQGKPAAKPAARPVTTTPPNPSPSQAAPSAPAVAAPGKEGPKV